MSLNLTGSNGRSLAPPRTLPTPAGTRCRLPRRLVAVAVPALLACGPVRAEGVVSANVVEEVIVTAGKTAATVQATPMSVSALSGTQLKAAGITRLEDLTRSVPGVSMRTAGAGQTEYEIRGVASNGGSSPTVAFYLDETPLSPPALSQSGKTVIDPDLFDLDRVEILRGPQGTLYGAGAMGGAIRVLPKLPVLGVASAEVHGALSSTEGGGANGGADLVLNTGVGPDLAVRLVADHARRSGWIDEVILKNAPVDPLGGAVVPGGPFVRTLLSGTQQAVRPAYNDLVRSSVRLSALYHPNDAFSALVMVMGQSMHQNGYDEFDASQSSPVRFDPQPTRRQTHFQESAVPEFTNDAIDIYSLKLTYKAHDLELTSATSYWNRRTSQQQDAGENFAWVYQQLFCGAPTACLPTAGVPAGYYRPYPYTSPIGFALQQTDATRQLSQEFRAVYATDRSQLVAGVFYSDLRSTWSETGGDPRLSVLTPEGTNPAGLTFAARNPYAITQSSVFSDGWLKIGQAWRLGAGVRWYQYSTRADVYEWGATAFTLNPDIATRPSRPIRSTKGDQGINPRLDLSYIPNEDLTVYATVARGFRPGGANQGLPSICASSAAPPFSSDSVVSYEAGEKWRLWDGKLTVNADLFYMSWHGVQQALTLPCGYQIIANAGNGRTFGPEIEMVAKPTPRLQLTFSGAVTDAKLDHPDATYLASLFASPNPNGIPGCDGRTQTCKALPILNVPRANFHLGAAYRFDLGPDTPLTLRVDGSHVGSAYDISYYYPVRLPANTIANVRASMPVRGGLMDVYVTNLTNVVTWNTANNTSFQYNSPSVMRVSTNQPRTIGVEYSFIY